MPSAIITKYHPVTASRGSRYSATQVGGNPGDKVTRVYQGTGFESWNGEAEREAAINLARKLGWDGVWVKASIGRYGNVWCYLAHPPSDAPPTEWRNYFELHQGEYVPPTAYRVAAKQ